jgi:hypothetical protein
MSYDAVVWVLVGAGLGVAGCLMLLMLFSALERFRLGQRLKLARHLRKTSTPRATNDRAMPDEPRPALALVETPVEEPAATTAVVAIEPEEKRPKPVDARSMIVAPPKPRPFTPGVARARPPASRITEKGAINLPPKPAPKPVATVPKAQAVPDVVASKQSEPAVEAAKPEDLPKPEPVKVVPVGRKSDAIVEKPPAVAAAAKPKTAQTPTAVPPGDAPAVVAKPVIVAANDVAPKPKLTVVANNTPAVPRPPVRQAKSFIPVADKKAEATPQPAVVEAKPVEAPPAEAIPGEAKPVPAPVRSVKALFSDAFTIEKLTVPGVLPSPDKSEPERK